MDNHLDWHLFLDVLGFQDNPSSGIIKIPASVLKHVNSQLCTAFTAKECVNPKCGREVSRVVCWKLLVEYDFTSFEQAHQYWREQCGLSPDAIKSEWEKLDREIDKLETEYYGKCSDDDEDKMQRQ